MQQDLSENTRIGLDFHLLFPDDVKHPVAVSFFQFRKFGGNGVVGAFLLSVTFPLRTALEVFALGRAAHINSGRGCLWVATVFDICCESQSGSSTLGY